MKLKKLLLLSISASKCWIQNNPVLNTMPVLDVNIKIFVSVVLFEVLTAAVKHNLTQFVRSERS